MNSTLAFWQALAIANASMSTTCAGCSAETKEAEDEVEARRARIDEHLNKPKVETRYEKKTGFWNWLKGY